MISLPIWRLSAKVGPECSQNLWNNNIRVFLFFDLGRWIFRRPQEYWQFRSPEMSFQGQSKLITLEVLQLWKHVNAVAATGTLSSIWSLVCSGVANLMVFNEKCYYNKGKCSFRLTFARQKCCSHQWSQAWFENWAFVGAAIRASFLNCDTSWEILT